MLAVYGEKLNHVTTNFGKKCLENIKLVLQPPLFFIFQFSTKP